MNFLNLKDFLEEKVLQYNRPDFIKSDPIQIPHLFTEKEDIEIAAFLIATIAWGNRKSIINNGHRLMEIMNYEPFEYIMNFDKKNVPEDVYSFVHRTFNSEDLIYFFQGLKNIYTNHGGPETIFRKHKTQEDLQKAINVFKNIFFELPHAKRTEKHVSDPLKNSAAKRINMFLRWMVRKDNAGVDFGIWKITPSLLSCPLDVHSGNVARKLGLLSRKQNDARAVKELDLQLRKLDATDPAKYDFALFGLGVFEKF